MSHIDDPDSGPSSTLGTLLTWVAGLVILGVAALVFLPVVMRPKPRMVSEVKSNLKAAYTAQRAYFGEYDRYDSRLNKIGFMPDRGNRYAYFLAERGPIEHRDDDEGKHIDDAVIVAADRFKFPNARRFSSFRDTGCPVVPCPADDGTSLTSPGSHNAAKPEESAFLVTAAGNIDEDVELDCWSICLRNRTGADGKQINGGEPYNDQSDL